MVLYFDHFQIFFDQFVIFLLDIAFNIHFFARNLYNRAGPQKNFGLSGPELSLLDCLEISHKFLMLGDKSDNFTGSLLLLSIRLPANSSSSLISFELEHHEFIVYL